MNSSTKSRAMVLMSMAVSAFAIMLLSISCSSPIDSPNSTVPTSQSVVSSSTTTETGNGSSTTSVSTTQGSTGSVSFAEIQRISNVYCISCHSWNKLYSWVEPGKPDKSYYYLTILHGTMPPGETMKQSEIDAVRDWILAGAPTK